MQKPDLCVYHSPCLDGFAAAYAVWTRYDSSVEYFPARYGGPLPNVKDKDVVLVDFSYKRNVLTKLAAEAKSILVLDHHKSAMEDLNGIDLPNVKTIFNMNRSGAAMAWQYFLPDLEVPALILAVEDNDLWKFDHKDTKAIVAALFSYDYNFETFDNLMYEQLSVLRQDGEAILRKHMKDVKELLKATTRPMNIGGQVIQTANLPYTMCSDAGNILAKENGGIGATYFDTPEGRKFSLRSIGDIDVSKLAEKYGGGGHRNASGFQMPVGWEGER